MVRHIATMVLAVVAMGAIFALPVAAQQTAVGTVISAADAHAKALTGQLVLVDIRRPEEWAETGLPSTAHAVTMHQDRPAFLAALKAAMGGNTTRPLAIICHSGTRTSSIYDDLRQAGFPNLINVAEGMGGGAFGPGWLKAGLPVRATTAPRQTSKAN